MKLQQSAVLTELAKALAQVSDSVLEVASTIAKTLDEVSVGLLDKAAVVEDSPSIWDKVTDSVTEPVSREEKIAFIQDRVSTTVGTETVWHKKPEELSDTTVNLAYVILKKFAG